MGRTAPTPLSWSDPHQAYTRPTERGLVIVTQHGDAGILRLDTAPDDGWWYERLIDAEIEAMVWDGQGQPGGTPTPLDDIDLNPTDYGPTQGSLL